MALADRPRVAEDLALADFVNSSARKRTEDQFVPSIGVSLLPRPVRTGILALQVQDREVWIMAEASSPARTTSFCQNEVVTVPGFPSARFAARER